MRKYNPRITLVIYTLLTILIIGVSFLSYTKLFTPFKMVLVGTIDSNKPEQINFYAHISEHTNPDIINTIERTLINAETLSTTPELPQTPDLYIAITNPKSSTIICQCNLWQQGDSLIIQLKQGTNDSNLTYKKVTTTTLLEQLKNL